MIIAHVVSSLQVGGQERLVVALAGAQRAGAERVMAVCLAGEEGALGPELARAGVEVVRVPKRDGVDPTLSARLFRIFRRARVDVVHTHNRLPLLYAAAAGKLAGARVVHTRHGPGLGTRRERWLRRGAARFTDAYVAVSPETARAAAAVERREVAVIENGVDTARFRPDAEARRSVRASLGIDDAEWTVGTVGRLAPEKDHGVLIRAASRLIVVGEGPERSRLEALAAGRPVRFLGVRADVERLMASFDVFALSSRMEGMPLVVLEAMATGLPIVATAVGGIPGVVGGAGLLAPAGDESALRSHLSALAADRPRARAMGAAGRAAVVARYSVERMVDRYWSLYRSAS